MHVHRIKNAKLSDSYDNFRLWVNSSCMQYIFVMNLYLYACMHAVNKGNIWKQNLEQYRSSS